MIKKFVPGLAVLMLSALPLLSQPPTVQLKVGVVQFLPGFDVAANGARIVQLLERLADQGVNVAVFPEGAVSGYSLDVMPASTDEVVAVEERIRRTCHDRRIAAVVGSIHRAESRTYDSAVVFSSRGELVEEYGKLMLSGEKWATPGNHIAFFNLEGVPSTVIICHDERYPELVRLPAMSGARIVYYISFESGMNKEQKLAGYRAQMMARAVENTVFVVAANAPGNPKDNSGSHGQSRIIQDDGTILKEASYYSEDILIESLDIKVDPERLALPEQGPLADWWQQGVRWMLANHLRKLD